MRSRPNEQSTRWSARIVASVSVIAMSSCGMCGGAEPLHVDQQGYWVGDECPNHEDYARGTTRPDSFDIPLAPTTAPINEYHDCQALINGPKYGALVGVWAAEERAPLQQADYEHPEGVAVAQVYNFSEDEAYEPLGIRRGNHCLYLFRTGHAWSARMLPTGPDRNCRRRLDPTDVTNTVPLAVRTESLSALPEDYPAVARWDRDDQGTYFIGLRCLTAWCEVGPMSAHGTSPTYSGTSVESVKGWYDEQILAVPKFFGGLKPSGVRGRIVPHAELASYTIDSFRCSPTGATTPCPRDAGWVPVATMTIDANVPRYIKTLNLRAGTPSEMYLRYDPNPEPGASQWQSRIVSGSTVRYYRVVRVDHSSIPVPATARWGWIAHDERPWTRCAPGCCTSDDDLGW